jgi:uncharacterized coiled-coil protein SlyX
MTKDRIAAVISLIMCAIFAISLIASTFSFSRALNQKSSEIGNLTSTLTEKDSEINDLQNKIAADNTTMSSLNTQIATLQSQMTSANNQISSLTNQTEVLNNQIQELKNIVNSTSSSELTSLIFHVCEKGQGYTWGHLPNATYTYNQILKLNKGIYSIMLLPEYQGDENWTATLAWLKQNFAHIPIVLPVFEGGNSTVPNRKLTIDQISEAIATLDIRELRIGEMASWYLKNLQPFPTDYITSILNFSRAHNLKVQWSEWQVNYGAFQRIQSYITGYVDTVTVTFQTNSLEIEPFDGFLLTSGTFKQWGGSIQSWYWEERGYGSTFNMPTSIYMEHTLSAKKLGAHILEFEPYWYLFDNGEPRENLQILMAAFTSG